LSLALAYFASNRPKSGSGILDAVKTERPASDVPQPQLPQKPAAEAAKPAAEEAKPAAEAAKPAAQAPKPSPGEPAKAKDVPN
jgi:hypothetical protein